MENLLEIQDLSINFNTYNGKVSAVRSANLMVKKGETLAIVGESGSGKSVLMQTVLKLTTGLIDGGSIKFEGKDITNFSDKEMQKIRGCEIGIIFQDAMMALNPTMKIGTQITESLIKHQKLSSSNAKKRAIELLNEVGINNPEKRFKQHIHNLSGGMRQRVMIAIALACQPKLLIADEPTTALDVTIQAQILQLLSKLQKETGCTVVLITHDLGVVAGNADRIAVMYAGQIVEIGTSEQIFYSSKHPYTKGLLDSIPRLDANCEQELSYITGSPPDVLNPSNCCAFSKRCKYAMKICTINQPTYRDLGNGHKSACFLLDDEAESTREKMKWGV